MESLFEANSLARIIITVIAVALAVGPIVADFNKTHATNPLWPGHARFHVVWQVLTNSGLCMLVLALLWIPRVAYDLQLHLAAIILAAVLAAFFIALLASRIFGGTLSDANGIPPFVFKLAGRTIKIDTNLFGFSIISLLLTFATSNIIS
jgi:hypothetical protein